MPANESTAGTQTEPAPSTVVVDPQGLQAFAGTVLTAAGVPADGAAVVATSLVDADLRGIHSHGVSRLGIYVERLRRGGNDPTGVLTVLAESPAITLLDAGNALGQIASARAVEIVLAQAGSVGCAVATVRSGSHFGAAGYWSRLIAERGCVGVASTNGTPIMVPWGSAASAVGTNPISIAFPSSGPAPVVVDFATSEATWGALVNAHSAGESIPDTWALDSDGDPTTDPAAAIAARRLLPFGRHKGSALAVAVELLTGVLAGASWLSSVPDMYASPEKPNELGFFFLAIDPRALGAEGARLGESVHALQSELNALPATAEAGRVLWPGQLEAERAEDRRANGIPLPAALVADLQSVADAVGVELAVAAH
jgi:LDH2 family malate/lactate/ureidoglycolate dehydrogenase